jgi:hypothetical protein
MPNLKFFIVFCLIIVVISGCAGLVAPFVHNPYAGTYNGTFTTSDGFSGPASVTLTNIGNVFGNLTDTKTNAMGNISGSAGSGLVFNGSITFPNDTHQVSGTFTSSSGEVQGVLVGPGGYTCMLDVTINSTTAKRP